METEQAKGRTWNGYVCPGCRNVFRVAADFAGGEVMCPSCQETLRLPKKPGDIPASFPAFEAPPPAPVEETQSHDAADQPAWRMLLATAGGRRKLALALGIPLLLVAVVLMLLPADESPRARTSRSPAPASPASNTSPATPAPPPDVAASNTPLPEPAPPALPEPAIVEEVPETNDPVASAPPPAGPEQGLVEAIPADTPAVQPPVSNNPVDADGAPVTMHTVVRGDTLTRISNAHRVSVSVIRQANDLKTDTVIVGQQLRIPGGVPQVSTPPPAVETPTAPETRHHTVVRGDTLTRIARKYSVDAKAIMRANGMKTDTVRLGAKLAIPPADP